MKKLILLLGSLSTVAFAHDDVAIDYAENVAPIFVEQCQMCHRENGIAPWAMTDYRMLQAFAPAIKIPEDLYKNIKIKLKVLSDRDKIIQIKLTKYQ